MFSKSSKIVILIIGITCVYVNALGLYEKTNQDNEYQRSLAINQPDSTHIVRRQRSPKKDGTAHEVFLGGSCNPTTWRFDIAMPKLEKLKITYYNPQVSDWSPKLVEIENNAKKNAKVLLFVIDKQTRNTASTIEVIELANTRRESLVLVVFPYQKNQEISGEVISAQEYNELTNGLSVLQYFMDKQQIPIFKSIPGAIKGISKIIRKKISVQDLKEEGDMKFLRTPTTHNKNYIRTSKKRDLYIGAVGEDLQWVVSSVVPLLKSKRLSFYISSSSDYTISTLPQELERMKNSKSILLIIPRNSRGNAIAALAAHLIGPDIKLTLAIPLMPNDPAVCGNLFTANAIKDYNRGRTYLSDYAKRKNVPVFEDPVAALEHARKSVFATPERKVRLFFPIRREESGAFLNGTLHV